VVASGKIVWIGRGITILVALLFMFSAVMKLVGIAAVKEGMASLGLPASMLTPLALLELGCAVVYLIPPTAVLGAVLLTGYLGGAILTHWRIGDPVYMHILIGGFIWLGIYLREERLKALLPLRR
jgi:hypothetical protein